MDRLERNKQTAMVFYDLMFNRCKPREAVERYTGGVADLSRLICALA